MPSFYIDELDITPDDFLFACSRYEINDLIDRLVSYGHLHNHTSIVTKNLSVDECMFSEAIIKLSLSKHRLSLEEENLIVNIANRL